MLLLAGLWALTSRAVVEQTGPNGRKRTGRRVKARTDYEVVNMMTLVCLPACLPACLLANRGDPFVCNKVVLSLVSLSESLLSRMKPR